MTLVDIVLLIIIGGFAMFGFWFGLIHTLGSLLGTAVGAFFATRWYEPMVEWIVDITGWSENVSAVLSFVITFVVINRLVGFLFSMGERFFKRFTSLPFIVSIDRFLGLLLGIFEGLVTLGIIFLFIDKFPINETLIDLLGASKVLPHTINAADILLPLIPEGIKELESTIDSVKNIISLK